ncbi:hypothetical protein T492DRAFT_841850 [Pavlovales sp. CCMP2436]|nr:hypothetical protein T492DRAFT_841850 [Pavlovales sp. CCMP2436]
MARPAAFATRQLVGRSPARIRPTSPNVPRARPLFDPPAKNNYADAYGRASSPSRAAVVAACVPSKVPRARSTAGVRQPSRTAPTQLRHASPHNKRIAAAASPSYDDESALPFSAAPRLASSPAREPFTPGYNEARSVSTFASSEEGGAGEELEPGLRRVNSRDGRLLPRSALRKQPTHEESLRLMESQAPPSDQLTTSDALEGPDKAEQSRRWRGRGCACVLVFVLVLGLAAVAVLAFSPPSRGAVGSADEGGRSS